LSYGIVDYNNGGKISDAFYKSIKKQYDDIISSLDKYFGKKHITDEQKEAKIDDIKEAVVDFLQ